MVLKVSALTMQLSSLLTNASASGKTRILLEGLWNNWGFYFTCADQRVLGSRDMNDILESLSVELNLTDSLPSSSDLTRALEHKLRNRKIPHCRFARFSLLVSSCALSWRRLIKFALKASRPIPRTLAYSIAPAL